MSGLQAIVNSAKKILPKQLLTEGVINKRLIWIGVLGVILLMAGGILDHKTINPKNEPQGEIVRNTTPAANSYEDMLEGKLANVLSQVKGAGSIAIKITLENNGTQEHAKNIVKESKVIQEKDTSGGIRTTTEVKESEQILLSKENGVDKPVMVSEVKPTIKGVLVIAEGAYDSNVKANLTKAVEACLGIPSYKITVLPQRK